MQYYIINNSLQIFVDWMKKSLKIYLYEKFLLNKNDMIKARNAELRIVLSLLAEDFLKIETFYTNLEKKSNKITFQFISEGNRKFRNALTNALQEKNPLLKSVCMLINYTYQMKNIESKINKGAIDKQKAEDLLFWDESECEDKNEQEITFIEQRVILQAAHKKFVDKNDIPILKKSGMKTRMEELIPHYKTNYFSENYPFDDILKLREHFIK